VKEEDERNSETDSADGQILPTNREQDKPDPNKRRRPPCANYDILTETFGPKELYE